MARIKNTDVYVFDTVPEVSSFLVGSDQGDGRITKSYRIETVFGLLPSLGYITEAPIDGNPYVRQDGDWELVPPSGVGSVFSVFGRIGAVTALQADYDTFFSLLGHTHTESEITDLQAYLLPADIGSTVQAWSAALDLVSGTNTGDQTNISDFTGTKSEFNIALTDGNFIFVGDAPTAHTHLEADITDLQAYLLDAPSDGTTYGRLNGAWSAVPTSLVDSVFGRTGAVVALVGDYSTFYAPLVHTHLKADITDFSVDIADINAGGVPSASTWLRGDGTWGTILGGVSSVFGRTAAVVALAGDYDAFYYTEAEIDAFLLLKADLAGDTFTGPVVVNDLLSADTAIIGDQGTEGSGITVNGTTYESTFKVSDIDGTNLAQTILHRHSTTLEPLIVGARSNSNTDAHIAVTTGQGLFSIFGTGWTGTDYKIFGFMTLGVDGGTVSDTSAPGQFTLGLVPNGSLISNNIIIATATDVTIGGNLLVDDEVYNEAVWNGKLEVPTKNALRDIIETLASGLVDLIPLNNTWTGTNTFEDTVSINTANTQWTVAGTIEHNQNVSTAALDEKSWDNIFQATGIQSFRLVNDANNASTTWMKVSRTALVVDEIETQATEFVHLGNMRISQGTAGDATLFIQADIDNNDENDHPSLRLQQDGAGTGGTGSGLDWRIGIGDTDTDVGSNGNNLVFTLVAGTGTGIFVSLDNGATSDEIWHNGNMFPASVSGARWTATPQISTSSGVMEIGRYIDFHLVAASAVDFDIRMFAVDDSTLRVDGADATQTKVEAWHSSLDFAHIGANASGGFLVLSDDALTDTILRGYGESDFYAGDINVNSGFGVTAQFFSRNSTTGIQDATTWDTQGGVVDNHSLWTTSNTTASTGYPTSTGQTFWVRGASDARSFAFFNSATSTRPANSFWVGHMDTSNGWLWYKSLNEGTYIADIEGDDQNVAWTLRSERDVTLHLEADTDNVTETDQPTFIMSQDNGLKSVTMSMASAANDGMTGTASNDFYMKLNSATENFLFGHTTVEMEIDNGTGDVIATDFVQSSDRRLKTDIRDFKAIDKPVRWREFRFKRDPQEATRYGVIAQELKKTHPELVRVKGDGHLAVRYNALFANQLAKKDVEIGELKEQLADQQSQIDELRGLFESIKLN